jgi:hypothetical protein
MAVTTPDTFNALNRYVSVRLQQGVPLVDADWNAVDDTRRFELRAFLKWYVGDGIPNGNDGFHIQSVALNDDFKIASGITAPADALTNVGRCLVNGLDVMISTDVNFKAQPLHASQPGAAALAAIRGVPVIQPPPATGDVSIYLDVWERRVTVTEDPNLLVAGVGVESCARLKREWVVRAHAGFGVPQPGDADALVDHSYYELARFTRAVAGPISPAILVDRRDQRLLLPPATLSTDLFGTDPHDYRRGLGRPALPLRDAINSLLRGEIPSTDSTQIAPSPQLDVASRAYVFDGAGGIVAFWRSNRVTLVDQIFESRIDMTVQPYVASAATAVSSGASHQQPSAARLPNGDLIVAYASSVGVSTDVFFKRGAFAALPGLAETPVANTAALQEDRPLVIVTGTIVLFFYQSRPAGQRVWNVRRYDLGTSSFTAAATAVFGGGVLIGNEGHAALDTAGNAWIASELKAPSPNIVAAQVSSLGVTVYQSAAELTSTTGADTAPFVLPLANSDVRVFWRAGVTGTPTAKDGLWCGTRTGGAWMVEQIPDTDGNDDLPSAVEDARGGIWLFWVRKVGLRGGIQFRYRDPRISAWGEVKQLIGPTADNTLPMPFVDSAGGIWVFWGGEAAPGNYDVWFKRLVPAI